MSVERVQTEPVLPGISLLPRVKHALTYGRGNAPAKATGREIELDFLRGLAILAVLDFHAPVHWMSYPLQRLGFPNFGWAGVNVFFVLSGFLVGGLLVREWRLKGRIDSRRFLIRRGFKIWPQYYVFLGLMLLTRHRTLHDLWGNLLNLQNYLGGIPHTWSLAVEEHAYLFLAICLAFAAKARLRMRTLGVMFLALSGVVVVGRFLLLEHGYAVVNRTHTRIEGILYGVVLAMVYHHRPDLFQRAQAQRWLWVGLLALALAYLRFQPQTRWAASIGWDAADLLGIALLLLLYRPGSRERRSWPYRLVAWIGVYSYGIYLWHVSVIAPSVWVAGHLPPRLGMLCLAGLPIVAGIALGAAFTGIVELPALKLRDRLYPRRIDTPVGLSAELEKPTALGESQTGPQPAQVQAIY